jgi:4-carboxymuconolactone decarboxylase
MKPKNKWTLLFLLIMSLNTVNAQNMDNQELSVKQKSIASIASLTSVGNLTQLKTQLNVGLDAGLTINEIKEILVQMYAYCGFPRCLNGINTFMEVVSDRKAKGIIDEEGKVASPISDTENKYETGKKTLQKLTGIEELGTKTGASAFTPIIDVFLKEHLFADIFNRDVLTYPQRELATISVLSALEGVAPQLQFHLAVGLNIGLSEKQLLEVFSIIETQIGSQQAEVAKNVLAKMADN